MVRIESQKYSGYGDERHVGYVVNNDTGQRLKSQLANREEALDLAWALNHANQQRQLEAVREKA